MPTTNKPNEFLFSGYRLDIAQRKLFSPDNSEINLSSRAFDTLLILIENRGETLSKADLMKAVWPKVIVEENNLNQAISSLRKAFGGSKTRNAFIQTIPGRGYRFVAQLDTPNNEEQVDKALSQPNSHDTPITQRNTFSKYSAALIFSICLLGLVTLFFTINQQDKPAPSSSNFETSASSTAAQNLIPNSIAVLPLTDLTSNEDSELFALGLHDEIINQLSSIRSLKVISRESVVNLNGQFSSIKDIGRQLQVESVITGTILFADNHARINLQMLEPQTGVTLWATTFDADTTNVPDIISMQSDIASNVARTLEAEVNQQELLAIEEIPTDSFEAYRFNLAAKNAYYAQNFERTWSLTNQAIELDPEYIDAHYLFSYVNTVLTGIPLPGMSSQQHSDLALKSAEQIIKLSPNTSEGYMLRATVFANNKQWNNMHDEVERLKQMGIPLASMKFYGLVLLTLGDFEGAIELFEGNLEIEPINLYGRGFLMAAYEIEGNRARAREVYKLGEELSPVWWGDTVNLFLTLGRNEPLVNIDDLIIPDDLKAMLNNIDNQDQTLAHIQEYIRRDNKISAERVFYSAAAAYINEHDLAVELMSEALEDSWLSFHWLWLPIYDETRKTEGFKELLNNSGIVNYWEQHGWPEVCHRENESISCQWNDYSPNN